MSAPLCMHFYITGRVQGVWFRGNTKKIADQLGLTGWTRNLQDGRVEVFACGEREPLAKLAAWLKQGPALAQVESVIGEEAPWEEYAQFCQLPDG